MPALRLVRHPIVIALLCGLAVLLVSILPVNRITLGTRPVAQASAKTVERASTLHYAVHVAGFSLLTCLAWFLAGRASAGQRFLAVAGVWFLGYTTEYLQHVLYHQPLEIYDVVANLSASAITYIGLCLAAMANRDQTERSDG